MNSNGDGDRDSRSGTVPYQNFAFDPPNGTGSNDFNGFQGASFTGQITLGYRRICSVHGGRGR